MAVKTCFHGNVNIDEHVITTTLKYSQIILRRNHQDLVVIHVALMVLKWPIFLASSPPVNIYEISGPEVNSKPGKKPKIILRRNHQDLVVIHVA